MYHIRPKQIIRIRVKLIVQLIVKTESRIGLDLTQGPFYIHIN